MKSILIRLRESKRFMSKAEQAAANFIFDNPREAAQCTVHMLAERTQTSPSSIVRMCNHIGVAGYKEFRRELIFELATLRGDDDVLKTEIEKSDSVENVIGKITRKNILSLEDTAKLLKPETLKQCADLLKNCRSIMLFGIGASLCVARDAYLKFLRLDKPCFLNDDWHAQLLQAKNATVQDAGLVISYSGETAEVISCMDTLRNNGTPIIAITRFAPSPVAERATYCLYTAANETLFRPAAMSSRISQLNVIDILYTLFANDNYDAVLRQLAKTHINKSYPVK